ncbi:hypothetical protein C8R42DRAFT_251469 [Lentinula raphanica]|nr:hypothetical protein C8R42DRAFT_251469 [Lentinula raphanica]
MKMFHRSITWARGETLNLSVESQSQIYEMADVQARIDICRLPSFCAVIGFIQTIRYNAQSCVLPKELQSTEQRILNICYDSEQYNSYTHVRR